MSEYWKSTPKYWCKHCSTYVRDTKLEKTNHEATPKHQGNLKRFLRDLHRGHEKDEKDKERAKNEVARLNGMVSGGSGGGSGESVATSSGSSYKPTAVARPPVPRPSATPSQRKQQLAQLAEMGVAIPDEFRPDMAMAGEWQVTSQKVVEEGEKKADAVALGVRKRELDEEEKEELEAKKMRWGSKYKTHPDDDEIDGDLDALLSNATRKGKEVKREDGTDIKTEVKSEEDLKVEGSEVTPAQPILGETPKAEGIKREPLDEGAGIEAAISTDDATTNTEAPAVPGVVFKKRKAKNIRQK